MEMIEERPNRFDVTRRIIEEIVQHRNQSGTTITKDQYAVMKKKIIDQMADMYNLDAKKRESLRKQYNRWFEDLGAVYLVHKKDPSSNENEYEIYIAPASGPKVQADNSAIDIIAGLSTSKYREIFSEETMTIPLERMGAKYEIPEFPEEHMLQMLIPSLRDMVIREYLQRLPAVRQQLEEELLEAQSSGNDKEAFQILKTLKRHSDLEEKLRSH